MKLNQVVTLISGMLRLIIIPLDIAPRGMGTKELQERKLWWYGPNWLSHNKDNWPMWNIYEVSKEILAGIYKEIKGPKNMFEISFAAGKRPLRRMEQPQQTCPEQSKSSF